MNKSEIKSILQVNMPFSQIQRIILMKRIIQRYVLILLLLMGRPYFGKADDTLQISLLTCSPGEELYSVFGHSAFRVKDPGSGLDKVFNYGTFNFGEKNFYLKFMRGKLNYYLSTQSFSDFMFNYQVENRSVYEQMFRLSEIQTRELYRELEINMAPQNRAYKYDFFWDNCSTRIRDKIESAFTASIQYPTTPPLTFRDYLHKYLVTQPWSQLGIDLILGLPADKKTISREAMYLPMEMMYVYDQTQVENLKICTPSENILPAPSVHYTPGLFQPRWVLLLVLAMTIVQFRFIPDSTLFKIFSTVLYVITGLGGLVIGFLWFFADHTTTDLNFHFLWANPLCLLYPLGRKLFSITWLTRLTRTYCWVLIVMIFGILFLPQALPVTCIPIWLSLLIVGLADLRRFSENK